MVALPQNNSNTVLVAERSGDDLVMADDHKI
jgi:hypothetical protein